MIKEAVKHKDLINKAVKHKDFIKEALKHKSLSGARLILLAVPAGTLPRSSGWNFLHRAACVNLTLLATMWVPIEDPSRTSLFGRILL